MNVKDIVILLVEALAVWAIANKTEKRKAKDQDRTPSKGKPWLIAGLSLVVLAGLELLFSLWGGAEESGTFELEMVPPQVPIFGDFTVSLTVVYGWIILGVVLAASLVFRFVFLPKFTDKPKGVQNVVETIVEYAGNYASSRVEDAPVLGSYITAIGVYMVLSVILEGLSMRAPTSDLCMTFAMALMTFVITNYLGLKKLGFGGRMKNLMHPTAIVFPFRVLSDIAAPVSLACRLFGNMLGAMVVVSMVYMVLGNAAVGIPAVVGLFFTAFEPLIQAYIFITLTLNNISEATEVAAE